jgi:hypothetical protein
MRRRGQLLNREQPVEDEVIDLTDRLAPYEHSAYRIQPQEPAVEPEAPAPSFLELHPWQPLPPLDRPPPDEPAQGPADSVAPITLEPEPLDAPAASPVVQEVEDLDPVAQEAEDLDSLVAADVPAPEEPEDLDVVLAELVRDEAEALEAAMSPVIADAGPRIAGPKQPRNEPCACGSGRKHKRCCGQKPATSQPLP